MTGAQRPMTGFEWSLLATLSLIWGGSFFFYKIAGHELPVLTIVLGRVGIAALALNLALARSDRRALANIPWRRFAAMALLNNVVPFSLIVFAETRMESGRAAILNATVPIFTVLVAHHFTRDEKISGGKIAGALFGFAGVAVLMGQQIAGARFDLAATGASIVAAISYAFAGVYGRRFRDLPPLAVASGQVTASTVILLPLVALFEHPWTLPPPHIASIVAILGLSLLCTALAYVIFFRLLATVGATNLMLVTILQPVSAIVLGTLVLGERIGPSAMAGFAIIAMGLAAIDGRLPARLVRRLQDRPKDASLG